MSAIGVASSSSTPAPYTWPSPAIEGAASSRSSAPIAADVRVRFRSFGHREVLQGLSLSWDTAAIHDNPPGESCAASLIAPSTVIVALSGVGCSTAQTPAELVREYMDLHRAGDIEGMTALHTEDCEFIIPGQEPARRAAGPAPRRQVPLRRGERQALAPGPGRLEQGASVAWARVGSGESTTDRCRNRRSLGPVQRVLSVPCRAIIPARQSGDW